MSGPKYSKDNFPKGALVFSATRKEKFDRCNRLWWLTEGGPLGLKEPDKGFLTFGTVLHAVLERWLKAPDLGITEAEMYPEGWDASISHGEAAQIKELVQKAIDQGVVARLPGQVIEHNFIREVEPPGEDGTGGVYINSTIDLLDDEGIQDHKTTKNMRYAKSSADLRENAQVLVYAMEFLQRKRERGEKWPEQVKLQHNVYCKDPNDKRIKVTKAYVTPQEVLDFWTKVLTDTIPEMKIVRDLETWEDVPGPEDPNEACNAYGGCFARQLCAKRETLEQLTRRLSPKKVVPAPTETKETKKMSLLDQIKAKQPGTASGPAPIVRAPMTINPPSAPPAKPKPILPVVLPGKAQAVATRQIQAEDPGEAPQIPEAENPPPWALAHCTACHGHGFNSQKNPCRICDQGRAKSRGITSSMFVISQDKHGVLSWTPREESLEMLASLGWAPAEGSYDATGPEEVEVVEAPVAPPPTKGKTLAFGKPTTKPPKAVEEALDAEQAFPEGAEEEADSRQEQESAPAPEFNPFGDQAVVRRGPGRPPKSKVEVAPVEKGAFVLYLGCRRLKGTNSAIQIEEVCYAVGLEVAKFSNLKEGFYSLDVWKRRDALASLAPDIARRCSGKVVMVNALTQDNAGLVESLVALAKDVFVADGFYAKRA